MNNSQWEIFSQFKSDFKNQIQKWNNLVPDLMDLQKKAAELAKNPEYPFETPIVYNTDLDKITSESQIKLFVIGDNPGKDEQLLKNNRYLVGQAGKLAEGFFKRYPELETDFRSNVIILNKTPVHSAKTNQLKTMKKLGGHSFEQLLLETQIWMANKTAKLHSDLCNAATPSDICPQLWLVGYSELKNKGIFIPYKEELKNYYEKNNSSWWKNVFVYQHFSMNCFTKDLNTYMQSENNKNLSECLKELGELHKKEIF